MTSNSQDGSGRITRRARGIPASLPEDETVERPRSLGVKTGDSSSAAAPMEDMTRVLSAGERRPSVLLRNRSADRTPGSRSTTPLAPRLQPESETQARPAAPLSVVDGDAPTEPRRQLAAPSADSHAQFVIGKVVGRGGFGEVLSAVQASLGRTVAVKRTLLLPPEPGMTDHENELIFADREIMFYNEALMTANLQHPNIVPVYDLARDEDGRQLLAMKLVAGRDWADVMEEDSRVLDVESYISKHLQVLIQVGQAVAYAHAHGIVHRDLKPRQVMMGDYGEVLLMDWGLAIIYDYKLLPSETLAAFGDMIPLACDAASPAGTPSFMAPEQTYDTADDVAPRTDVYLLGGILYQILTGTPPHQGIGGIGGVHQIREKPVPAPQERAPDCFIPPDLADIAMKALSMAPKDRYESAKAFIGALQEHAAGAHRRRESLAITERVVENFETSRGDYREHSQNLALLSTAEAMWPSNHLIAELRERILQAFIRDAIANRDFTLARLLLDSMPAGQGAAELGAMLDKGIQAYKKARRLRSKLMGALVLAVVLLIVAAVVRDRQLTARIHLLESVKKAAAEAPK